MNEWLKSGVVLLSTWRPNQEQIAAAVRWLLGVVGTWAVQKGWIDDSQALMITGIGVAFVPLVWTFIIKTQAAQAKTAAALPDVTVVVGPEAPAAVRKLAIDPTIPNIKVKAHGINE